MTNNDVLRRLRYVFDLSDNQMIAQFTAADAEVSREQISAWLKKDEDDDFETCNDTMLATFLNGFINTRRGKREGPAAAIETRLSNNIIFRKIKIAMDMKDDDVIAVLALADLSISKHELSAFFRKQGHKHYRECKDQVLRNFIKGLQIKYRGDA